MEMAANQYQRTLNNNVYNNGMVMQAKVNRSMHNQIKPKKYFKGVVKKVLSGDAVIIRKLKGKDERQINFSNVIAPKLARRPTSSQSETPDEPCAWMAREFLRKKLIGEEIQFTVEAEAQSGREYGTVFLLGEGTDNLINMTEMMVAEGLLTVRREIIRSESKLTNLEDAAKDQGKGKWRPDANTFVRDIKWSVGNLAAFVDQEDGKPVKAIIEHVCNGSTVRLLLLPDYHDVTLIISGIKCQMFKEDPYAEEARYFIESRLLQRDVEVYLEMYNENNLVGTIKHPYGNIAELLLKEGYAKCVDWSMGTVTGGAKNLRSAEKLAKSQKLRMWTNYEPPTISLNVKEIEFQGKVTEVVNGDALFIKNDGNVKKIFLSSIRSPRLDATENQLQLRARKSFRPLYDIPWLYEAREFLRQKLIGQKVHVTVDYVQPAQYNFQEKVCCTVKIGEKNVSQEMVRKGLASVIRHRQDDDQRSSCYDDLLSAEAKAIKDQNGLHSKRDIPIHRVTDISGDPEAAEYLLPILYEEGITEAIVEFVASGSRMRLFIPRESCLITFLLEGITCPKAQRPAPGGAGTIPGEPFGAEALMFTKNRIFQRKVQIEVDKMDKGGNFIGWLHYENLNLAVLLVKNGLSTVHRSAEGTRFAQELYDAENKAKEKEVKIWANCSESVGKTEAESEFDNKSMIICEVTVEGLIFGQYCSDRPVLESLMNDINKEISTRPPIAETYSPKRGDLCAAQFVDGNWYRAKVESVVNGKVNILYIDYGNQEITDSSKLAPLASQFISQPKCAHEFALALTKFPRRMYIIKTLISHLMFEYEKREVKVKCEYKMNGINYCTVQRVEDKSDVAMTLLLQGLLRVEKRKDVRLQSLLSKYYAAQNEAWRKRLNIWEFVDY